MNILNTQNSIQLKYKSKSNYILSKATDGSAGIDLPIISLLKERGSDGYYMYKGLTGIYVEIPQGYFGILAPRSSFGKHFPYARLANTIGIIDSDYRGELIVLISSTQPLDSYLNELCTKPWFQLVILPSPNISCVLVDAISATERGDGGFGSTNK